MPDGETHLATFWDHLDDLRGCLLRSAAVVVVASVVAFFAKDILFGIVLAPSRATFPLYRLLGVTATDVRLINVGLTEQFAVHVKMALSAGLLVASPWVVYELFRFVAPGLYAAERRMAVAVGVGAYAMFVVGALVCYVLVFPLTLRFLATYQVSPEVGNMLTLDSYADTLAGMTLVMGVVFEMPVVSGLLGRLGLVSAPLMTAYRRHAIVAILVVAAIVTPTTDCLTLLVVALPMLLLYEASILIVKITARKA